MKSFVPIETGTLLGTAADSGQLESRSELERLFSDSPLPPGDLFFNIGLYIRSSLLVKFLVMHDLYKRIVDIPGALIEFGVWWGQNLVLLENLRAILEPFNKQRMIIGFDTFTGYPRPTEIDKIGEEWLDKQAYATGKDYKLYLAKLLEAHEGCNALGHLRGRHRLIEGDVIETAPKFFKDHPETIVAFAYFDLALYAPTLAAMTALKPHLVRGSVILLDEFTHEGIPGEAIAFKETFDRSEFKIEKCHLYPSKSIVTIC